MPKPRKKLVFSYLLVTFLLLSGGPPKSLFRYFFVTLNFSGFRALWDLLPLTIPGGRFSLLAVKNEVSGNNPVLLFLGVFVSLVFFLLRTSLVVLSVFCLFFSAFKGSRGEKNPWCFEVFLGLFEKTKEKKDRET